MTAAPTLTPDEVIEKLGGGNSTAEFFDVSKSAVSQWRANGVPKDKMKILFLLRPDLFRQRRAKRKLPAGPP